MSEFPSDWPGEGPIDLQVHDLPHGSSSTEWWYVNTHLETSDRRKLSVFAAFFRVLTGRDEVTKAPEYAHSVTWAITDVDRKRYFATGFVDKRAPQLGLERVDRGEGTKDNRLRRALKEMLVRGRVPYPDRMFEGDVFVSRRSLELDFDGTTFKRLEDGRYELHLKDAAQRTGASLVFAPEKPVARHGDNGVVKSIAGEDMFYYFIPRCGVTGSVTLDGVTAEVGRGQGWYDHEFGRHGELHKEKRDIIWNWASVQFEGGSELTAFSLTDRSTGASAGSWAVLVRPDGQFRTTQQMTFTPGETWRSTRTFFEYPVHWRLEVPDFGLSLKIDASFEDQEFISLISKPAFWEGRCTVTGTQDGAAATGLGYIEISNVAELNTLDDFFGAVGREVRKSVNNVIPFSPSFEKVRDLIGGPHRPGYMDGVDVDQFERTMIKPVREITDRGGKSWRSYAALACCDVVGGDSRKYVHWLALPEFLHVGSLIVDDVQDKSTIRRGGPTAHLMYGEPIALNAGTACYFMGQGLLTKGDLSNAQKLRLYDLYFEALRAGHAGQAFDLDGLASIMPAAVEQGDGAGLEKRVLGIHRLKTAAPAGALARMGALAGGGTDVQIEGLGNFFEAVGLAFQIMDDVLNLKGFRGDLKTRGEDISHGKVTMPIAKAIGALPLEERRWVWNTTNSRPEDPTVVAAVVEKLIACGALQSCEDQSAQLVEDAWARLSPLIEDSQPKLMLRAFGWYVLERHY
jgi:geranylgeranyl pyrophosphate synthase/predicted secreted hydrolase